MSEQSGLELQRLAVRIEQLLSLLKKTRLYRDAPRMVQWSLLRELARNGLGVASMHALHAELHPSRPAVVDDHQRLSYREFNTRINRLANGLRAELGEGRHPVLICVENRAEYLIAWMAAFRLGWPAVHASDSATGQELRYLVDNSGAEAVLGSKKTAMAICDALGDGDHDVTLLLWTGDVSSDIIGGLDFNDFLARQSEKPVTRSRRNNASENVVYTSGTTGRPKGTVRDMNRMGLGEALDILSAFPLSPLERHLIVSKLYHSAGQVFALLTGALGGTVYFQRSFSPENVLRTIHEEHITSMFFVPTMLHRFLDQPAERFARYPMESFRFMISGAAPFPQALRERAIARFGAGSVYDFYGASELGWVTLISGHEMLERPASVGRPLSSQRVRVIRSDGSLASPGEVGIIQVSNDMMMDRYLHNDEATAEVLDEGWMTVDDTGYLDEDGYLYVTGRDRDMVITGGVNVYPAEIEEVLLRYDPIDEVAVIGIPDDEWGERLEAVVVARDGCFDGDAAKQWAKQNLAGYKVPKRWHVVDELPRNDVGKVLKRTLRETYAPQPA